ncbi:MAG: site-2 protease family protein [Planctomycetota bacterium]|jgi:membrane-associated protease RseP (regulator of RpoE activity)
MSSYDLDENGEIGRGAGPEPGLILAELVRGPPTQAPPDARIARRRVRLPALLFVATCLSTLLAGTMYFGPDGGWQYALPVMTILICHEAGHFLQARRYGVYASFPYFIPMPISPLGTLGAVIVMEPRMGHRRALFDIGISGPLAGLVPTLVFCVVGLQWSSIVPGRDMFGDPFLFKQLAVWLKGPIPEGHVIQPHPMAFAGWVGLLVTSVNLLPIGQLDGGHILYGLLRTTAHKLATLLLLAGAVAVVYQSVQHGQPSPWMLMLILLFVMGPVHPPTANDHVPLGAFRTVLGWLTLAFIPIGLTWNPFPGAFGQ